MKTKILIVLLVICLGVVMSLNYNQHRSLVEYQEKLITLKKEKVKPSNESDQSQVITDNVSLEKIEQLEKEVAEKDKELQNKVDSNNEDATLDDIKESNKAFLKASFSYDDVEEQKKAVQELSTRRYADKLKSYVSDFEANSLETSEVTSRLTKFQPYLGHSTRLTAKVLNVVTYRYKENGISQNSTIYTEIDYRKQDGKWLVSDVVYNGGPKT